MAPYGNRTTPNRFAEIAGHIQPSIAFIVLIFGALIAFEIFNYSTTEHALSDILGDLAFAGIPWSTILALAFCGIDFAGIARLFTPEQGANEPKEVWYLFAAWLMAATMNAVLTWWGVSMAVKSHAVQGTSVVDPQTMNEVIPVFVAVLVWLIRILIIGTLSMALDRYLNPAPGQFTAAPALPRQQPMPTHAVPAAGRAASTLHTAAAPARPSAQRPLYSQAAGTPQGRAVPDPFEDFEADEEPAQPARGMRPEPSYHTLAMSARPKTLPQSEPGENNGARPGITTGGPNRARRF